MIINFYMSEQHSRLWDQLKLISEEKERSVSYVIREAIESYVNLSLNPKRGKTKKEAKR
jgi:predicted DNA-binding protein